MAGGGPQVQLGVTAMTNKDCHSSPARHAGFPAALALLAALLTVLGCADAAENPAVPGKGSEAPDFTLENLEGETVKLSQFRDKSNVLLHFGTTWCPPCRAQAPRLDELHEKYASQDLVIISVDSGEAPNVVREFVETEGAKYMTLLDTDSTVSIRYGVKFIPLNILVDKSGRIYAKPSNAIPEAAIAELAEAEAG